MNQESSNNTSINARFSLGDNSGQIAIGSNISQTQSVNRPTVTQADLDTLQNLFDHLKEQVRAAAPPDKQAAALERVEELQEAIAEPEPDLSTMEYVKRWFAKHVPQVAGAVASVVVHPIVGKIVEAAGDLVAEDFRQRFTK
ncbi:MAG: hypothetical protein VKK04_10475 [Synechococcales bacterium]|nr:hypothetical protein [Synechococcales bacterium]